MDKNSTDNDKNNSDVDISSDDDEESVELDAQDLYGEQAVAWSYSQFGTVKKAHLYSIIEQRNEEDQKTMCEMRKFRAKIMNVKFTNSDETDKFFLKFCLGYNFSVKKRSAELFKKGEKKTYVYEESGKIGKVFYSRVHKVPRDSEVVMYGENNMGNNLEFDAKMKLRYIDLYDQYLRIELWDYNQFTANRLRAWTNVKLIEITRGPVSFELDLEGKSLINTGKGKKKKVEVHRSIGTVKLSCVIEEVLEYRLKFDGWKALIHENGLLDCCNKPQFNGENDSNTIDDPIFISSHPTTGLGGYAGPTAEHRRTKLPSDWETYAVIGFNDYSYRMPPKRLNYMVKSRSSLVKIPKKAKLRDIAPRYIFPGYIRFTGTKMDLEDSLLYMKVFKKGWRKKILLASCTVPLKNIVAGSSLSMKLKRLKTYSTENSTTKSNKNRKKKEKNVPFQSLRIQDQNKTQLKDKFLNCGAVDGIVNITTNSPLWRDFLQIGDLQPPELRDYEPYSYTYLALRIVKAENLLSFDETGTSNPSFAASWAGQRLETSRKTETLNPMYGETLYFHVRSFDKRPSIDDFLSSNRRYIDLTCWSSVHGNTASLGTARLYLHHITGADPKDKRNCHNCSNRRLKRKSIFYRKGKNKSIKQKTVRTRTFEGPLRLKHGEPMESTVFVEAWFRGPQHDKGGNDIVDLTNENGSLIYLPHYDEKDFEIDGRLICHCPGQLKYSFNNMLLSSKICKKLQQSGEREMSFCASFELFEHLALQKCDPRGVLANEIDSKTLPDGLNRFYIAMNHRGNPYFLPTFLSPISCPKDMFRDSLEMDAQYAGDDKKVYRQSLRPFVGRPTTYKPNTAFAMLQYASNIEFTRERNIGLYLDCDVTAGSLSPTLLPTDITLDLGRGDIRDHAILLCSLMLGEGMDAYVCMGTVRTNETSLSDHWWVMTREDHNGCVDEDVRMWGKKPRSKEDALPGAVRFWEVTDKGVYDLPQCWMAVTRYSGGSYTNSGMKNISKSTMNNNNNSSNNTHNIGNQSSSSTSTAGTGTGAASTTLYTSEDQVMNITMNDRDTSNSMHADEEIKAEEIFLLGPGVNDAFGQGRLLAINNQISAKLLGGNVGKNVDYRFKRRRHGNNAMNDPLSLDGGGVGANHQRHSGVGGGFGEDEETYRNFQRILLSTDRYTKYPWLKSLPYASIVGVFNDKNVWMNAQVSQESSESGGKIQYLFSPEEIRYDFGLEKDWVPLIDSKNENDNRVFPHYITRGLTSKLSDEELLDIKTNIQSDLAAAITNIRDGLSLPTTFEKSSLIDIFENALVAKHEIETIHKIHHNQQLRKKKMEEYEAQRVLLSSSVPPGHSSKLRFVTLNLYNPEKIRKVILGRNEVHHDIIAHDAATFCIAVQIFPYHNEICVTRVGIMTVFPDNESVASPP